MFLHFGKGTKIPPPAESWILFVYPTPRHFTVKLSRDYRVIYVQILKGNVTQYTRFMCGLCIHIRIYISSCHFTMWWASSFCISLRIISSGTVANNVKSLATRSEACVCGRSLAGIAGANPAEGGYCCLSRVNVVCCQVEVAASGWSLGQRNPTECGVSKMSVIAKPHKGRPWPGIGPKRHKENVKSLSPA
jgi:hypothetical protein